MVLGSIVLNKVANKMRNNGKKQFQTILLRTELKYLYKLGDNLYGLLL
jgi:hypothetical protein